MIEKECPRDSRFLQERRRKRGEISLTRPSTGRLHTPTPTIEDRLAMKKGRRRMLVEVSSMEGIKKGNLPNDEDPQPCSGRRSQSREGEKKSVTPSQRRERKGKNLIFGAMSRKIPLGRNSHPPLGRKKIKGGATVSQQKKGKGDA